MRHMALPMTLYMNHGWIQDSTFQEGAPTYDFVEISQKLHEIEKILGSRVAYAKDASLDPPV